jgi:hypothetical protein
MRVNMKQKGLLMGGGWLAVPLASMFLSLTSVPLFAAVETDLLAAMTGTCRMLKIAESDFLCSAVTYSHTPEGRSGFTIVVNNPDDDKHIITFSGDNGKIAQDNLYELTIDRMLLKSKDSAKVDGMLIPLIEMSTGKCSQIGNLATWKVASVSCLATDQKGRRYEFHFESDGSPAIVRRITTVADADVDEARAKVIAAHIVRLKCWNKAAVQSILPRYRTDFILRCMEE